MVTLGEVRARVAAAYAGLGMPTWPNPHPGGAEAREEEYSRVTDPARYGVVHARARVWADRLGDVPGVEVQRFERGFRIGSSRAGTLPLLLMERDAPLTGREGSLAVLHISIAQPEVAVQMLPDCGCDACDFGSDDLLETIDETIGHIVGGPFVVLRGKRWHAQWHPDGGSASGLERNQDFTDVMELCRRLAAGEDVPLPKDAEAFIGHSWFS